MTWFAYIFWLAVGLFCINIALQIYYGRSSYSRVDHIKNEMTLIELQTKQKEKTKKYTDQFTKHLGVYDNSVVFFTDIFQSIKKGFYEITRIIQGVGSI